MGKFQPGQSGNPSGRPPKSKALSDLLIKALNRTVPTAKGRISGKRLLASLVSEGLTTGKVTFPGEEKPSTIGVKDWIEFVKWAYGYLEPAPTKVYHAGHDGEGLTIALEYVTKNYDTDTGLSPGSADHPQEPG